MRPRSSTLITLAVADELKVFFNFVIKLEGRRWFRVFEAIICKDLGLQRKEFFTRNMVSYSPSKSQYQHLCHVFNQSSLKLLRTLEKNLTKCICKIIILFLANKLFIYYRSKAFLSTQIVHTCHYSYRLLVQSSQSATTTI